MKIQYVSDIHLELLKIFPKIKKISNCENLILAGDIGFPKSIIYKDFINYCSNTWKNTFVLFGNHEYRNKENNKFTMTEIEQEIITFPKNVYCINNKTFYLYKDFNVKESISAKDSNCIKIIGSTLWSNINDTTAKNLNDYKRIYTTESLLTPQITRLLFITNKEYIIKELNNEPEIQCIIVTHHGTHSLCHGYYYGSKYESGYCTYIPELFKNKNLIACINGHTHSSINIILPNNIKLLANCMGYQNESLNIVKYNPKAVLNIF